MTKKELIDQIAIATGVTKQDTKMMVDAITHIIADELVAGEDIRLPNVGTFKVKTMAAHTRFNALAGGEMVIPEQKRVRFKPVRELRERLNNVP